jgi:hypothetical protein
MPGFFAGLKVSNLAVLHSSARNEVAAMANACAEAGVVYALHIVTASNPILQQLLFLSQMTCCLQNESVIQHFAYVD